MTDPYMTRVADAAVGLIATQERVLAEKDAEIAALNVAVERWRTHSSAWENTCRNCAQILTALGDHDTLRNQCLSNGLTP